MKAGAKAAMSLVSAVAVLALVSGSVLAFASPAGAVLTSGADRAVEIRVNDDDDPTTPHVRPLAGRTRYETSFALASGFANDKASLSEVDGLDDEPVSTLIVASGESLIDAAASASLAVTLSAPVMLMPPNAGSGSEYVVKFIEQYKISRVVILGGLAALSGAAERLLRRQDGVEKVERIAGENRFDTALEIALRGRGGLASGYCGKNGRVAILAVGDGDDLSHVAAAGVLSFRARIPVLLTSASGLPAETRRAFARLATKQVILVGDVPSELDAQLAAAGIDQVTRLAGDAAEVSVAVERELKRCQVAMPQSGVLMLISSQGLPDGISATALVAFSHFTTLFVDRDGVAPVVVEYLRELARTDVCVFGIWAIGGEEVLSPRAVATVFRTINEVRLGEST